MHDATKACSHGYFGLLGSSYVPLFLVVWWAVRYLSKYQKLNPDTMLDGDLNFTNISFKTPTLSFVIGIMCSLLGIGGGELMGPMFLAMGIKPQVSSATTSIMSLLSTSLAVIHYLIRGTISLRWIAILFTIGLVGGVTGRFTAIHFTRKYQRPSLLIFLLAAVLFVSLCLLVYKVSTDDSDFNFHNFC